jgi:molybdopterin-guanine dinucleotide biosynthesis protein B
MCPTEKRRPADVPVVCFVAAKSGTGKTTILAKVIRELNRRGYEVGTVKSDTHGFEMDQPGKDTWKFMQAGAKATAIIGPDKYALIQSTKEKQDLDSVASLIHGVDIILVEGYKGSDKPRIEVIRKERGTDIVSAAENLIAVVTDVEGLPVSVPVLNINDAGGVADFLVKKYLF